MPTPKATELQMSSRQIEVLKKISRKEVLPYNIVFRAKLLDYINDTKCSNTTALNYFHCNMETVTKWRSRWLAAYNKLIIKESEFNDKEYEKAIIEELKDESGRGVKPKFTQEQVCQLYSVACENPEECGYPITNWTSKELRMEMIKRQIVTSISTSSIARFLKKKGI